MLKRRGTIIVECEKADYKRCSGIAVSVLEEDEYIVNLSSNRILLLITEKNMDKKIKNIYDRLKDFSIKIGIGRIQSIIYKSVKECIKSIELGSKLYNDRKVHHYEDIEFYHNMDKFFNKEKEDKVIELIRNESKLLVNIILAHSHVLKVAIAIQTCVTGGSRSRKMTFIMCCISRRVTGVQCSASCFFGANLIDLTSHNLRSCVDGFSVSATSPT